MGCPKAVTSLMCPLTVKLLTVTVAVPYLKVDEAISGTGFMQQQDFFCMTLNQIRI